MMGIFWPLVSCCRCSDYMIFLDWARAPDCHSLDIPARFRNIGDYTASLAHKTNHSFHPNSLFARFYHPVFGLTCLGLKTLKKISRGEEIFVNYRIDPNHAPVWFNDL